MGPPQDTGCLLTIIIRVLIAQLTAATLQKVFWRLALPSVATT